MVPLTNVLRLITLLERSLKPQVTILHGVLYLEVGVTEHLSKGFGRRINCNLVQSPRCHEFQVYLLALTCVSSWHDCTVAFVLNWPWSHPIQPRDNAWKISWRTLETVVCFDCSAHTAYTVFCTKRNRYLILENKDFWCFSYCHFSTCIKVNILLDCA